MRLSDLENCDLDETVIPSASNVNTSLPQNILSRTATKLKKYLAPRSATRAANTGRSKLANEANQLKIEYLTWLHSTWKQGSNVQPTLQNILEFLTYKKIPIGPTSMELIKKIQVHNVTPDTTAPDTTAPAAGLPVSEAKKTKEQQLKDLRNTIVLSDAQVNEIITQVVGEKNLTTFGASTTPPRGSAQQATTATVANIGRSRGRSTTSAAPTPTPTITIDSVVNFYETLKPEERTALRQRLDAIDAAPATPSGRNRRRVRAESLEESTLTPQQVTQITTALTAAGIAADSIGNVLSNLGGPAAGATAKTTAKTEPDAGNKTIKPTGSRSTTAPGSSTLGTASGPGQTTLGSQGVAEDSLDKIKQLAGVSKER